MSITTIPHRSAEVSEPIVEGSSVSVSVEEVLKDRGQRIEAMLPLVRHIVARMAMHLPSHISKDDLIGAGVLGLVGAVDHFNAERGCSLKTYCTLRIRGSILDDLRRQDWIPRSVHRDAKRLREVREILAQRLGYEPAEEEVRQEMGLSSEEFEVLLDRVKPVYCISMQEAVYTGDVHEPMLYEEIVPDDHSHDGCHQLLLEEDKQILTVHLQSLPKQQAQVLTLYYLDDLRLKEIAQVLGLTESRVSQIHTLAISRLRSAFERSHSR